MHAEAERLSLWKLFPEHLQANLVRRLGLHCELVVPGVSLLKASAIEAKPHKRV